MDIKNLLIPIMAASALAACDDYDPVEDVLAGYTEEEIALINSYTENFVFRYGEIDKDHDWGFGRFATMDVLDTRSVNPNGNEWVKEGYDIPAPITDAERQAVVEAFRKYKYSTASSNLTDFFVQHVYEGSEEWNRVSIPGLSKDSYTYTSDNGESKNVSGDKMDYLSCGSSQLSGSNEGEHVNNFNGAGCKDWNGCMRMLGSSSAYFAYKNSTDGILHGVPGDDYIVLTVEWTENGVKKSGTYLGFDFRLTSPEPTATDKHFSGDDCFDDWIIKIVPAVKDPEQVKSNPGEKGPIRVMCEDLGNTYDFDFNDLVFDVRYVYDKGNENTVNKVTALITVQAAGGTLPIYLGQSADRSREAHSILGVSSTSIPVNVASVRGVARNPGVITLPLPALDGANENALNPGKDIDILVGSSKAGDLNVVMLPRAGENNSIAPQKIAADVSVKWPKESQQIEDCYSNFSNWVNKMNNVSNWWDPVKDHSLLYDPAQYRSLQ